MGYAQSLLGDDEKLVHDLHPHAKALLWPVVWLLLLVAATAFGTAAMPEGDYQEVGRYALWAVAALLLVLLVIVPFLRWRTTHYVITSHRVLIRHGIVSRQGRDVPLSRINDVSFSHGLVDRMLRCGSLTIESAGERGQVLLQDVPRVESVHRELYELTERDDLRRRRAEHDVDGDGKL